MADTTARIRLALEGQGQVVQGLKQVEDGTASLKRSMASLVGGLSLGAAVGQLVQVQREFDVLNSSLITVTGSSAAAQREMKWIKEFAASTPYGLNEVTSAFVKMKALGLDPSQKALTSYGNTASAMGKGLNQMIEAVADAATGEFERLKEFGIKAKKQGDDVSLTFRGVTTNIGNNAGEITTYLQKLGDNDFAGAMATRAATLDGAISNLGDSWDELFRTVSQNDVGGLIAGSVRLANAVLGDAVTIIQALNGGMRENARDAGIMVSAQSAVAAVFETVAVLGANFKFVLVSVGRELGGIAAQAVQILQGNFAGAAAIRGQLIADGEAARREVDATTARVLNARRLLGIAATGVGMDEPRFSRLLNPTASTPVASAARSSAARTAATKANTAAEKELAEAQKQSAQVVALRNKLVGEGFKASQKNLEAARAADADLVRQYANAAASAQQRLTDLEHEAEAVAYAERNQIGLAQAVELTTIARLKEQQVGAMGNEAIVLQLQAEIEAREKIVGMLNSTEARDAGRELRKNEAAEWARTWDQVSQSFTDALMQGGKSVAQYLKDLFRTLVLRPILAPVGGAMASLLGGPASAGQGGGIGSLLSGASSLNSMWGALSGSINTLGSTTIANGVGAMGGDALGTLANLQGGGSSAMAGLGTAANAMGGALVGFMAGKMISGGYSAIGKSGNTAVVAGTAIGMAVGGPIGAAIGGALGGAVNRLFGRKLKDSGITGEFGGDAGFSGSQYQFFKGGLFRSDKTKTSALDDELRTALASQYELLADNTSGMAGQLKLSASALETYTRKVKFSTKGLTQDQITQRITEEFEAMGEEMAQLVLGTTEYTRTGEAASATLLRLSSSLTAANGMLDVLGTALFSVGLKGADMASHLVDQFGGLDAMVQASAAYYQAFYSETERADTATRLLTERMSGLGVSLPATTSEFRALVDGLDLTTESGRKTYAELLKLSPEFAALQAELQRLAEQTAAKLIATFTARGQLVPVLGDLSGALVRVTGEAGAFAGPVSTIHRLLGDAASGTLTFGDRLTSTSSALTMSQAATAGLQTQILALRTATSGAVVDMQGLSAALRDVDTLTFVETVVGVFELIGQRIKNTLGQIADERVAAREAAMGIINPGTMSAAQIRQQIAGTALKLPTTDGIEAAQRALAAADAAVSLQSRSLNATREWAERSSRAVADASANLSARQNLEQLARNATGNWNNDGSFRKIFGWAGVTGPGNLDGLTGMQLTDFIDRLVNIDPNTVAFSSKGRRGWDSVRNPYLEARNQANSTVKGNDAGWLSYVLSIEQAKQREANAALAQQQQALTKATTAQAAAAQQAQQAQLDYVASLQAYSVNAAKAVTQLGRLRGETVKYYEAQQQLAGLMTGTATGLRDAVAQYHFDQMDPAAQLANLQDRFNVAYSMALSTSGETLAGYGAELTQLLNPLLAKAQEAGLSGTQYSGLVSTILARAEAVAQRLDKLAPQGYEQESLSLLGQIDSTLAALEAGTMTADQLIVNAINAGKDSTRDGLRAVVAALTGQAVPAFAMGGMHAGGVRLVGENGPELEVTGPSRIYSAAQTRGMLGGADTGALVQEIRALRVEVGALRADNKVLQTQIMTNTGKTARQLDRWDGEGLPVKNLDGETLAVKSA